MVIGCPKCKAKLKVADEKIKPEGSKFKCPKCASVLVVRKPAAKVLDRNKILVAHANPEVVNIARTVLLSRNYNVLGAFDGVSAMIKAMRERPFLAILDVALPKIHGFEVSKRLSKRPEAKGMKILLISSAQDEKRQRRQPASMYGAYDYIDDHEISTRLLSVIDAMFGIRKEPAEEAVRAPEPELPPPEPEVDERIERAKRLARTILSDIELYNPQKVADAIKNNNFHKVFASELKEGLKHYERRIPQDVREKGDFFNEAVNDFVNKKRKALGIL